MFDFLKILVLVFITIATFVLSYYNMVITWGLEPTSMISFMLFMVGGIFLNALAMIVSGMKE